MCPGDWSKCGLMLLLLLHMHLGTITGQPGNDIIVCSVVWTSHRVVLSVGRIQQRVTSFGSHRRNTGRSLWVSISSYKHRSDLVRCGSGSGETTVVEGEQNPAVGLCGRPRGGHWPPKTTSRILSTDCWCQLVPTHATKAFWMAGVVVVGWNGDIMV